MPDTVRNQAYGYRWVVLAVFSLITAVNPDPVADLCSHRQGGQTLSTQCAALAIDFLSLIFMLVFVLVCIPASWVVDTKGHANGAWHRGGPYRDIRPAHEGILSGKLLPWWLYPRPALAVAQPFILNSATKVAAQWFPLKERAIAVGIATLAQFAGIIVVMVATPLMIVLPGRRHRRRPFPHAHDLRPDHCRGTAVILMVFLRERPPSPP